MWASLPCCSLLLLVLTSLSVIRILLYWWPASMVCSIFISNASPTQAIGRQSFVSSSPSCCGSTFGMGQKSRFAGDNVMLGTKRKEYFKRYNHSLRRLVFLFTKVSHSSISWVFHAFLMFGIITCLQNLHILITQNLQRPKKRYRNVVI